MKKERTTAEKCKFAQELVLRRAAEVMAYKNWSKEFALEHINDYPDEVKNIDPNDMTAEELEERGFGKWDDDSDIMLIPLWMLPFLPNEVKTTDIMGKDHTKKSEIDNDNRFGYLAYGVVPKDVREKRDAA